MKSACSMYGLLSFSRRYFSSVQPTNGLQRRPIDEDSCKDFQRYLEVILNITNLLLLKRFKLREHVFTCQYALL